jgi:glycosyltransferase involved in cell wall biosynthesis
LEVLFVGNFRHDPNREAAEFLVREMAPRFPDLSFVLPGPNAPEHLAACSNIQFPGYIPDIRVLYHRPNTIVVAPLFSGTGQRVKLLEAFAMQCPVVTTSIGAFGFPVRDGNEVLIANNKEEFVKALQRLVISEDLRRDLGQRGREMIMRSFKWERIGEQMIGIVEEAVTR